MHSNALKTVKCIFCGVTKHRLILLVKLKVLKSPCVFIFNILKKFKEFIKNFGIDFSVFFSPFLSSLLLLLWCFVIIHCIVYMYYSYALFKLLFTYIVYTSSIYQKKIVYTSSLVLSLFMVLFTCTVHMHCSNYSLHTLFTLLFIPREQIQSVSSHIFYNRRSLAFS